MGARFALLMAIGGLVAGYSSSARAQSHAEHVAALPVGGTWLESEIDGETIAVGAPSSSLVVVFVRDASGSWVEQTRLERTEAPPLGRPSRFGLHVALAGDTLFVAGTSDYWVFRRTGEAWTEEYHFGSTTSLNGVWDVAAWDDYVFASRGTSSVLVLRRGSGGTWSSPWISGGSSDSMHGIAVQNGVVAYGYPNARTIGRGLVRVYRIRAGGTGLDPVTSIGGGTTDEDFGEALALSPDGTTLFVGATDADRPGSTDPWQGACDVFALGASSATHLTRLRPGGPASLFGSSIGAEAGFAVVGGSPVRLFANDGGAWTYQDTLVWSADLAVADMSGRFVVVDNDVFEIVDGRGLGVACDAGAPCGRGECVDGVCCDDPCDEAATGCAGCALSTGATHDGRCTPMADGTTCDDGLACSADDVCASGACTSSSPVSCDDGDPCTADACAEPAGCEHTPIAGCAADGGTGTDAGTTAADAGADGGATADGGGSPTDGGLLLDGGDRPDDGGGADARTTSTPPRRSGGCSCSAAASQSGAPAAALCAILALALLSRRALRGASPV